MEDGHRAYRIEQRTSRATKTSIIIPTGNTDDLEKCLYNILVKPGTGGTGKPARGQIVKANNSTDPATYYKDAESTRA